MYEDLSSPNVQNQMEWKHNFPAFKELYRHLRNSYMWISRNYIISSIVLLSTLETYCGEKKKDLVKRNLSFHPVAPAVIINFAGHFKHIYIRASIFHLSRSSVLHLTLACSIFGILLISNGLSIDSGFFYID